MTIGKWFPKVSGLGRGNILRRRKLLAGAQGGLLSITDFLIAWTFYAVGSAVLCGYCLLIVLPTTMLSWVERRYQDTCSQTPGTFR